MFSDQFVSVVSEEEHVVGLLLRRSRSGGRGAGPDEDRHGPLLSTGGAQDQDTQVQDCQVCHFGRKSSVNNNTRNPL